MIRDREQPLNPPGIDAPDRKIVRQYIPMREYDDIEANGFSFWLNAEVEACGNKDADFRVSILGHVCMYDENDEIRDTFKAFLDSYISPTGPTWRELIEREICRQAALLPCTTWEVEYEGDASE
jgi:hypothetical protein